MAELGVFRSKDEITVTNKLGRAGQTIAMHLGDGRLGQVPQPLPTLNDLTQAPTVTGHCKTARATHRLQIVPGTERPSGPADDEHTSIIVALEFIKRAVQFRQQLPAHSVELLRPVQGDAK